MMRATNKLPQILFGIVMLCFLLPFVNVSCSGQEVMSITGLQMLTGVNFQEEGLLGEKAKSYHSQGEILAAIVLFIAACGFLPLLLPFLYFKIWDFILSIAGAVLLLVLKEKVADDLASQSAATFSGITIDFDIGFWLAFLVFVSILVFSLMSEANKEKGLPGAPDENSRKLIRVADTPAEMEIIRSRSRRRNNPIAR